MNRFLVASILVITLSLVTACELEPQGIPYEPPQTRVNMELVKNLELDSMGAPLSTDTTFSVCHQSTNSPRGEIPEGCRVIPSAGLGGVGYSHSPQDVGGVELSSMALGMIEFPLPNANNLCKYPYLTLDKDYADGEAITHAVTGGVHMDAVSVTVDAPSIPVLTANPLVRGQPWTLQWTGTEEAKALIWLRTTDVKEKEVICYVPDSGSLTIPGVQTAEFAAAAMQLQVQFRRSVTGIAKTDDNDELVANVRIDMRQGFAIAP